MRQYKQCVAVIERHKEDDILGRPVFSIKDVREVTFIDRVGIHISTWLKNNFPSAVKISHKIFHIEANEILPCRLEVYPGQKVQDIVWKLEQKDLDPMRFEI